ncbi:MAG TPA: hypothetical protein VJ208_04010 [Candidatus Nanoarchaeia archaeon]|nr:hypothetical protein [Candidatus Nanoarchaeia archaeon]
MSILDWYFGQKSQKKINKEIVGRLENDLRRCLNETDKYTKLDEGSLAEKHLNNAVYLKPIFGDGNREIDGFFNRVLIYYASKFLQ